MTWLVRLYGWPHELLHVLALRLIGRKPDAVRQTHVDIPDDLSTGQYVFVAGFPALIFALGAVLGVRIAQSAPSIPGLIIGLLIAAFFALGIMGTIGDLMLILARIMQPRPPESHK